MKPLPLLLITLIAGAVVACLSLARWRSMDRPAGGTAAQEVNALPLRLPLEEPRIVVLKGTRQLNLFAGGDLVRTYRIALGFAPEGDKAREGDGRTPEGAFYICGKNPDSRFYRSLWISYPSAAHARRGRERGTIGEAEYRKIARALARGGTPPQKTALGGEIFIHGNGSQADWTAGCIALDDTDMKELYEVISTGTPVEIRP